jgi:hypoxanthine phosphoribosyltransferase
MGNRRSADAAQDLEILLDAGEIAARVRELGEQISFDYRGRTPHLVGVLKGAWVFMADLIRHLSIDVTVDFLGIQSYGAGVTSSGEVKITKDLDLSIDGRDVLVVEDVLDTGRTYHYLAETLSARQPHTLKLVALLDKASRRIIPVRPDYVGFEIPNVFVVGYGLDYDQKYRGLPDVRILPAGASGDAPLL